MFLALSPLKSLFQIARRRRISRIFTTNEVNVEMNLLTSAALVLNSRAKTYSIDIDPPIRHLAKG